MLIHKKDIYGGGKRYYEPNTFIGGVGNETDTIQKLTAELSNELVGNIENFQIDANNLEFYAGVLYNSNYNALRATSGLYPNIVTYFIDAGGNCKHFQNSMLRGQSKLEFVLATQITRIGREAFNYNKPSGLKHLYFPKLLTLDFKCSIGTLATKRLYIPKCVNYVNNPFSGNLENATIYVHPSKMTSNNGGLDSYLNARQSEGCIIKPVTNFAPPSNITDLTAIPTSINATINFTTPASTNALDFYEVWLDDGTNNPIQLYMPREQELTATGQVITGLSPNTTYKLKLAACDEFYNGSGMSKTPAFSNEITFTTPNN